MFKRAFPLALAGLLLAGCQSTATDTNATTLTPTQAKEQALQRALYEVLMTRVLRPAGNLANTEGRTGSFNLKITLDEHNRVIGCDTQINRTFDPKLYPYNAKLAKDLLPICWTAVLPELPSSLINPKKRTATVVAPIAVGPLTGMSDEQRLKRDEAVQAKTQDDFLYQQLFAPLPVDSIGVATLIVMTDNSGHVQECAASLAPHVLRRTEFKQDDVLLRALIARCKQTDMSAMPGFKATGLTSLVHRIEYTPWKAGLKADTNPVAH